MVVKVLLLLAGVASSIAAPQQLYQYQYEVKDEETGTDFGQQEFREGNYTEGSYTIQLPDTRLMEVTYYVDGESGYVAQITFTGEAVYPEPDTGSLSSGRAQPVVLGRENQPRRPTPNRLGSRNRFRPSAVTKTGASIDVQNPRFATNREVEDLQHLDVVPNRPQFDLPRSGSVGTTFGQAPSTNQNQNDPRTQQFNNVSPVLNRQNVNQRNQIDQQTFEDQRSPQNPIIQQPRGNQEPLVVQAERFGLQDAITQENQGVFTGQPTFSNQNQVNRANDGVFGQQGFTNQNSRQPAFSNQEQSQNQGSGFSRRTFDNVNPNFNQGIRSDQRRPTSLLTQNQAQRPLAQRGVQAIRRRPVPFRTSSSIKNEKIIPLPVDDSSESTVDDSEDRSTDKNTLPDQAADSSNSYLPEKNTKPSDDSNLALSKLQTFLNERNHLSN